MEAGPGFALLSTMVASFAEMGITTVFEGIEEGWQLELAEKSGASMVQGYVLARPELVPASFSVFRKTSSEAGPDRAVVAAPPAPAQSARPVRAFGRRTRS